MKRRMFRGFLSLSLGAVIVFALLSVWALYAVFEDEVHTRLSSALNYVALGMESAADPDAFLKEVGRADARITWVDAQGAVRYDSEANTRGMPSHIDRPEIRQAMEDGQGGGARWSATLGEITYYAARRLADGSVVRVALTRASLLSILMGLVGILVLLYLVTSSLSIWAANRLTKAILRPINTLDLDHPLDNEVYEELTGLLTQLDRQNKRIAAQMAELTERQTRFAAITDHMAEGLVLLDRDENILSINRCAADLFRVDPQREVGRNVLTLCREMAMQSALRRARTGASAGEALALRGRHYQLLLSPVLCGEKMDGLVLLVLDVTDKELSEQSRREFSANVSHELKTPLTAILGYAEIMHGAMVPPEDMRVFAGRIHDEAGRLIRLVEDIIHLSRLDEGAAYAPEEAVDIAELARQVARRLSGQADRAGVTVGVSGQALTAYGDRGLMEEVLFNLMDNAIKYNRPGGRVDVETGADSFTVRDTGAGIAQADQARVFERFYRADKSHSKNVGGTGLGLSIVKHAVQRMGAIISLHSVPGEGTRIRVVLPPDRLAPPGAGSV